jgi:amidase
MAKLPVPLGVQGVLTRSVRDTARFHAESERHRPAPALPPIGLVEGPGNRRVRVALTVDAVRGLPVDGPTLAATRDVARLMASLGHHVDEVAPAVDDRLGTDFLRYWQLIALGLVRGGASVFGPRFDPERTEPLTRDLARRAASCGVRMPGSIRRLRRLVDSPRLPVPQTHDVVLSPVLGHVTPLLGHLSPDVEPRTMLIRMLRWVSFTPPANVTGAPAISLPLGRSPSGLPIGVQLTAPLGQERLLLELAFELEAAAPWSLGVGPVRA